MPRSALRMVGAALLAVPLLLRPALAEGPQPPVAAVAGPAADDARIAALRSGARQRKAMALAALAGTPPSGTACTGHDDIAICHRRQIGQALALLVLDRSRAERDRANDLLAAALADIPRKPGWQGREDPAASLAPADARQIGRDELHFDHAWHLWRIWQEFGAAGTRRRGLITARNQADIALMAFAWARDFAPCQMANIRPEEPAIYWGSENHGMAGELACYAAAVMAQASPALAVERYADGSTPQAQLAAWTARLRARLLFVGSHGTLSEAYSPYVTYTLGAVASLADLAPDETIRRRARALLDLFWISWAEEQVQGIHGGARARVYPNGSVQGQPMLGFGWLYFDLGSTPMPGAVRVAALATYTASDYTPPDIAYDLVLDPAGRGRFTTLTRGPSAQARLRDGLGYYAVEADPAAAPLMRQAYTTPDFVMGTWLGTYVPWRSYLPPANQNLLSGVAFGPANGRNIVAPRPAVERGVGGYSGILGVQDRATQIVVPVPGPEHSLGQGGMRVAIGDTMAVTEADAAGRLGWVFAAAPGGYAAIRVVGSAYEWAAPSDGARWMVAADRLAPVVVQAAGVSDFATLDAFRTAVLSGLRVTAAQQVVTVSGGLFEARPLRFDYGRFTPPTVGGMPIEPAAPIAWASPYLRGAWGSPVVTARSARRETVIDLR